MKFCEETNCLECKFNDDVHCTFDEDSYQQGRVDAIEKMDSFLKEWQESKEHGHDYETSTIVDNIRAYLKQIRGQSNE